MLIRRKTGFLSTLFAFVATIVAETRFLISGRERSQPHAALTTNERSPLHIFSLVPEGDV
ncbi:MULTISPECIES: hypothetical protein [Planktothricoides]|uniref:Uncharacterized protein n=1 Tax=Planktothricoides raciborskii FACHB-1370 TaxID=2949576 RepID=A0ABR8EBP0_9CYAN|nr:MULTISPECIES: hypothetical protein [Planktothricoides]MBD2543817.1 hypothetical protein [Planktothricoides raciborskii FACHB-1370]MBD2583100.1 hypothetical protein [Planktothricoides raciborskii FACHB-1261]